MEGHETFQKNGCVHISSLLDDVPQNSNYELFRLGMKLLACTPIRFIGIYILADGSAWKNALDFVTFIMGRLLRLRTRVINGKSECREIIILMFLASRTFLLISFP